MVTILRPHRLALALSAIVALPGASFALDRQGCAALSVQPYPDLDLSTVEFLTGASQDGTPLPDHCRVVGHLERRIGEDGKPYATGFELRLPADWNERFYFQGGGGVDGSIRPAIGVNTVGHPPALTLGFAVVSTDAGHDHGDRSDTSFGLEPKARVDWGYNAIDITSTVAKSMIQAAYGTWPRHSYFVGSSNGGRQGLVAALRHPNQFDGIIAQNPIREQTRGHVASAWSLRVLSDRAPQNAEGKPVFTRFFDAADNALLVKEIQLQCDALDGLEDGIVDSAKLCLPDFSVLLCQSPQTGNCLSQDQIDAFTLIHEGPMDAAGRELYAPFAYDAGSDFMGWHIGDAPDFPNNGRKARNSSMHEVFREPPAPNFDPYQFDFESDPDAMRAASQFTDATSNDLDAFKGSGGKILIFHGMGDSGVSAIDTTRWFDTVHDRYGRHTSDFARLYLLTGVQHDRTGIGPHVFPGLEMLMTWVEQGQPPDGQFVTGGEPARERPLCSYPTYVVWDTETEMWKCEK